MDKKELDQLEAVFRKAKDEGHGIIITYETASEGTPGKDTYRKVDYIIRPETYILSVNLLCMQSRPPYETWTFNTREKDELCSMQFYALDCHGNEKPVFPLASETEKNEAGAKEAKQDTKEIKEIGTIEIAEGG